MVNSPLFTTLNQIQTVSGIPFRVTASETWYYSLAVDPFLRGSMRSNREIDACEALTERLRELAEMVEAVAPLQD